MADDADLKRKEGILELATQLEHDYAKRNKMHQLIDEIIYLRKEPRVPEAFPNTLRVQAPLAPHIINTIVAALSMKPFKTQRPPVNFGPSGESNSLLLERFMDSSWKRQERERKQRLFRLFMHALAAKGESVLKTVERTNTVWEPYHKDSKQLEEDLANPDHEEYGDIAKKFKEGDRTERDRIYNARTEEMKRGLAYPITTLFVPPDTFYPIRGEDGFNRVLEIKTVPYYTLEKYGMTVTAGGKVVKEGLGLGKESWSKVFEGSKQLRMIESWSPEECVYVLCGPADEISKKQGQEVRRFNHKYGDMNTKTLRGPYFHAYGVTTSSRELEYMGLSVIFGWLKIFPWLDELLTIQGAAAYQFGYPKYRRRVNPADGDLRPDAFIGQDEQDKIDKKPAVEPGAILPWDIEPVDAPKTSVDLGKAIDICRELISLCLPNVVAGLVNGDESGYLAAQATHLARLVWQPIVDNAEFCLADRADFEAWLIDKVIGENVYVWGEDPVLPGQRRGTRNKWLSSGPDDFKGVYGFNVQVQPTTPSQDVIRQRTIVEQYDKHLIAPREAIEELGHNPAEVKIAWMLEELEGQLMPDVIAKARAKILATQQAEGNAVNDSEAQAQSPAAAGGNNGRLGTVVMAQPGQNGEPIEPAPAGNAGGSVPATMPGPQPVSPNVPPAAAG